MENVARIIITIFFIGLIAIAIIFFGVFGLVPLEKVGKVGKQPENGEYVEPPSGENPENGVAPGSPEGGTNASSSQENPPAAGGNGQASQPPAGGEGGGQTPPVTEPSQPEPYVPPVKIVRLDVPPGSPDAPQQSPPLVESQIPKTAIRLVLKDANFHPPSFLVKKGQEITLAIESGDNRTHVFMFKDPSLSAIAVGIGPKEIRAITFTPPAAGEFWFYCNVPGHEDVGESGKMVVID